MLSTLLLSLLLTASQPGSAKAVKPQLSNDLAEHVIMEDKRLWLVERISIQNEGRIDQLSGLDAVEIEGGWEEILSKLKGRWSLVRDPSTNEPSTFVTRDIIVTRTFDVYNVVDVKDGKRVDFFWTYSELPELVARYTGQDWMTQHKGEATLKMQAGQWVVASFKLPEDNRPPFKWTDELHETAEHWKDRPVLGGLSTSCSRDLSSAASAYLSEADLFDDVLLTRSYIDLSSPSLPQGRERRVWLNELTDMGVSATPLVESTQCGYVLRLMTPRHKSWVFGPPLGLGRIEAEIRDAWRKWQESQTRMQKR
jgi:hypothetical protein